MVGDRRAAGARAGRGVRVHERVSDRDAGRLENVDSARAKIALHLAQMVDEYPENVGLWQQYRAAEAALREVGDNEGDGLADLFRAFDAEVRNAANGKPSKPRR